MIVQLRRSVSSVAQLAGLGVAAVTASTGWILRVPRIQNTSQTKPSAPVIRKAARQPKANANGGMSKGVRMAPILGAVLNNPSANDRWRSGRYTAAVLTAAGVPTDSAAASATRATTNCCTVDAKACAMPARLHNATPSPSASRTPTRSMNQPTNSSAEAAAIWNTEPRWANSREDQPNSASRVGFKSASTCRST